MEYRYNIGDVVWIRDGWEVATQSGTIVNRKWEAEHTPYGFSTVKTFVYKVHMSQGESAGQVIIFKEWELKRG